MADFNISVQKTIKNEGGEKYTETLGDRGGATKYGISLKFMIGVYESPEELKKAKGTVIDRLFIRCPTKDTIRYLTECEAKFIYKLYFWDANRYGEIEDKAIAEKVFDMAVLMGAPQANKILQCCLGVENDGIIGEYSLRLVNAEHGNDCLPDNLAVELCKCFISRCNKHESQRKFLLGWLNRVMS